MFRIPRSMPAPQGGLRVALAIVPAVALAGIVLAPSAAAAADDEPVTRWSVTPSDDGGQKRVSIQHALEPGETASDRIEVRNLGEEEATFRLSAADGFTNANGRFDMLRSDQESVDAGTWIDIEDEVTVAPGESASVPFEITVPEQAEPGDHPAGVAASVISTGSAIGGASVGVESRVGVKVITRVKGDIAPSITVDAVAADYRGTWNPFRPGRVELTFALTNSGNTRLTAEGVASAGTAEATFPDGESIGDLLPGDTREVTVEVDGAWPTFYVPGELVVTPSAEALDGSAPEVETESVAYGAWAVPWAQLLVLLAIALIVIAATWNRRRGRRRLDAMLAEAREEGRRSAEPAGGAPMRAVRGRRVALVSLAAIAAAVMLPSAATAADDAPEDGGGVGVHVTIDEADADASDTDAADADADDAADADAADTDATDTVDTDTDTDTDTDADADAADADADTTDGAASDADDQGDDLATTGLDPVVLTALVAAAVVLGVLGVALMRRRAAR